MPNGEARATLVKTVRLALVSVLAPPLAILWAGFKCLFGPATLKNKILAISICGNILFASLMIWAYVLTLTESSLAPEEIDMGQGIKLAKDTGVPLAFYVAPEASELGQIVSHAIYLGLHGTIRAWVKFANEDMAVLKTISICDARGRPWMSANLDDGSLIYYRYADSTSSNHVVSLLDRDGDGIPEEMMDWEQNVKYELAREPEWVRSAPTNSN